VDSGITALIGAAIGASSAIISSWITFLLQKRNEHRKWLRDKKQEAYSNAMRYLLRTKYKRSKVLAGGTTVLSREDTKEWFDDIIMLMDSLVSLSVITPREYAKGISKQATEVKRQIEDIFYSEGRGKVSIPSFIKSLDDLEQAIKAAAARDMSGEAKKAEQTQQEEEEKSEAVEQHKTTNESKGHEVIRQPDQDEDSSDKSAPL
jgi:hypothetical protein